MTAPRTDREAGFSLVETMVTVAIVGLMASLVVLSLVSRPAPAEREAERLLARLIEAGESAVVTGETVGFTPEPDGSGYLFLVHRGGTWRDLPDHPALAPHTLPAGVRVFAEGARERGREPGAPVPLFWFDPTGFDEPFTLLMQDSARDIEISRDGSGTLSLQAIGGER